MLNFKLSNRNSMFVGWARIFYCSTLWKTYFVTAYCNCNNFRHAFYKSFCILYEFSYFDSLLTQPNSFMKPLVVFFRINDPHVNISLSLDYFGQWFVCINKVHPCHIPALQCIFSYPYLHFTFVAVLTWCAKSEPFERCVYNNLLDQSVL